MASYGGLVSVFDFDYGLLSNFLVIFFGFWDGYLEGELDWV
mgnify:FL=1